jgi:predicted dehydrogenase
MPKRSVTRRGFLKGAAAAGAAAAFPLVVRSSALGLEGAVPPSERITLGAVGLGGQGTGDLNGFLGFREVQAVAVCDVIRGHRERAKANVDKRYGNHDCAACGDFREVTRRPDIDAVLVATPDHWHAIPSIDAMRHGKDVYCEKPLSLTIREGRAMADTARRYGRVFSCGSQRVRGDHGRLADLVASGAIGRVQEVYINVWGPSKPCDLGAGGPVPEGLDWDFWLGPAPWRPYHPGVLNFRPWRDYSGGGMTDWGAHHFAGALYALKLDSTGPVEVIPPDGRDHPYLTYVFANGIRMYHSNRYGHGIQFIGSAGQAPGPDLRPRDPNPLRQYRGRGGIFGDWLHCVRTRQAPFQDVEYAHRTATVCHLGNIAYILQRPLKWDPARERFVGDEEADRWLDRPKREPWRV